MICHLCASMPLNVRTNRRHERLQQIGVTRRIARGSKAKAIWVTEHMCEICATEWRHVDDPCNPRAGWSQQRQRRPELCE